MHSVKSSVFVNVTVQQFKKDIWNRIADFLTHYFTLKADKNKKFLYPV